MHVGSYRGRGLSRFRTLNTAAFYVEIKDKSDIAAAFEAARERGLKVFVLGGGSNVFFENSEILIIGYICCSILKIWLFIRNINNPIL